MVATRRTSRGLPPLPKGPSRAEGKAPKTEDSQGTSFASSTPSQTRTRNTTGVLEVHKQGSSSRASLNTMNEAPNSTAEVSDDDRNGDSFCSKESTGHFLQGIQLEGCADVLSIPDPPSPGKVPARRFSTPVARPLRNISNASDAEDERDPHVTSRKKDRSKRKSMPSFQPSQAAACSALDNGVSATPISHDAAEEMKQQSSKRRKKRQSIILPSDLEASDGNTDEYTKTYATFKNDPSPPATPARETKTPSKPLTTTLYDIRQIIHEYTAIPKGRRDASAVLNELFDRTEYPVRSTNPEHDTVGPIPVFDPSTMSREQKVAFFTKIGPELQRMDACKVSDAKMVAEVTQCKPQKARGGFYRYVHSVTGRPVAPEEFEERYLMMLEEVNHIRSQAWKEYFFKLREESCSGIAKGTAAETKPCTEEKMQAETPAESTPCTEKKMQAETCPNPQPEDDCTETHDDEDLAYDDEEDQFVLPFPSRDEESSNPVIARAERKLWNAIDEALAEYSREVLAAKKAAPQTPVHC